MGYFNFYLIKKFFYKHKKLILFIAVFMLFLRHICFATNITDVNITNDTPIATYEILQDIVYAQEQHQNSFVIFCLKPFLGNTETWQEHLLPIFDKVTSEQYNIYCNEGRPSSNTDKTQYEVFVFRNPIGSAFLSNYTTQSGDIYQVYYGQASCIRYFNEYYYSTNSNTQTVTNVTKNFPSSLFGYKSDMFISFCETIYSGNYTGLLNSINNYLDNIDSVNSDILTELESISSALTNLPNNLPNNTQQINSINNKISDILQDNDTIISQNSSMIQQQEQINDNIEETNEKLDAINDTITDDTVESSASDLPSTDVNNPTENGIDNIFQSIYNAFCIGEAQDIVFPIPFTNKNITLSPYYVRDSLNNNNAGWVYTLIQAFWGYLIGRYIVSDISKKIDKIKSGNIENIENSNIKEEML